ncbi:MAG: 1-acyl-sn-glycerol-3-phosphate acyltransferase [Firmicutes bacterium]|nr:1-acyl-sn-glycerol-3-phosphate acyltransferase [Candidatus Fiminaster equi]
MIKLFVLIGSFGLSTLITLLLNFNEAWMIAVGIIGIGLAFVLLFGIMLFFIAWLFILRLEKNETPEKYSKVYRKVYNRYQLFLLSLFGVKLTVNGLYKVPKKTNFILFQNHLSNVDPIFTDYVLRKFPMIFVAKESLFKIPFFGRIIRHIGYVKVIRKSGLDDTQEMARGLKWIQANECSLCVYPEGTRNKTFPNPIILDLKEGTMSFAKKSGRPIVISAIHGTEKINDKLLLKVHKIQIDILEVIPPEEYEKMSPQELADLVRKILIDGINNPSKEKEKVRLY